MKTIPRRASILALLAAMPVAGAAVLASVREGYSGTPASYVAPVVPETIPDEASKAGANANTNGTVAPQQRGRRTTRRRTRPRARATARPAAARLLWTSPVGAPALTADLGGMLLAKTRSGEWGAMVVSLTRGDTLFAHNPGAMLQPASTMKLFTAALALEHLGPDYAFRTPVLRDAEVGPDGVLRGSLYLQGAGDPSLTPRYFREEAPMDILARQVAAAGIRRVEGDIVADVSLFENRTVPEGWQSRYLGAAYAARVSPLSLNENLVWVVVQPNGKTAEVTLDPATSALPVRSTVRVTGGSGGRITAVRTPDGIINVRGTIGSRSIPRRYSLVVDDPATFTAGALHAALQKAGVVVTGSVRAGTTPDGATPVAYVQSPPLSQIVSTMNRESINVFAELLFRAAARKANPSEPGSAVTGQAALRDFMTARVGVPASAIEAADGSGLSVLDRVTPRSLIELLDFAHQAPWGATFHASLPVAGQSETLRTRMRMSPAEGNLHAKTGTTNTVSSLGGYVTARNGEVLAFAFVYNGSDRWNARATMDQMGATLANFIRD